MDQRWSVGELARASGLTVRALHHYDEIGLLCPSERTASGHRRYTEADLRRLYRVRALRQLGLPLGEIAKVLADSVDDLTTMRELLVAQLGELAAHGERIGRLKEQIRGLLDQIDDSTMPGPNHFLATLEMSSVFETYFTQQQRDFLATRREEMGEEAIDAAKALFVDLVARIRQHQEAGTPVDDPEVRDLVARWDEMAGQFHGGDEQIKATSSRMWEENRAELDQRMGWQTNQATNLVTYLRQVREAAS
jgi:DNA-binding transcriptional MerR regulator